LRITAADLAPALDGSCRTLEEARVRTLAAAGKDLAEPGAEAGFEDLLAVVGLSGDPPGGRGAVETAAALGDHSRFSVLEELLARTSLFDAAVDSGYVPGEFSSLSELEGAFPFFRRAQEAQLALAAWGGRLLYPAPPAIAACRLQRLVDVAPAKAFRRPEP